MKTLTVWYSVGNGGDGSAYPHFMESEELVEWDQDNMDEGWGESCTGSISFQSESDIFPVDEVQTKEGYLIEHYFSRNQRAEFIKEFFPDGLPTFRVEIEETGSPDYKYNNVFVGDKKVARVFKRNEESGETFTNKLNKPESYLSENSIDEDEDDD